MKKKAKHGFIFLWGIVLLAAFTAVIMVLWNLLIPSIFGLGVISFWQALGLFVLARILFGGFGLGHRMMMGGGMRGAHSNPIHEKWMKMSPEERKEFINRRKQFGFGGPFGRGRFDIDDNGESNKEQ